MRKISYVLVSFGIAVSLLLSSGYVETHAESLDDGSKYEVTLDSLRSDLNKQRKTRVEKSMAHTAGDYGTVPADDKGDYSWDEAVKLTKSVHFNNKITTEKALEDVDEYFRIIKSSYAGYNYFGGDKRFGEARKKVEERVKETYKDGPDRTYYFYLILKEELSFVKDSNFRIGRRSTDFIKQNLYYDTDKLDFLKDKDGFYTEVNGEKLYLTDSDSKNLYLTVSDQGTLVYGLFIFAENEKDLPKSISLKSENGETTKFNTTWMITNVGPRTNNLSIEHELYEKDGIPVTTLTEMSIADHHASMNNDFINEAKDLRDKKTFILDLRENKGGLINIADFFMYNLTGSRCEAKIQYVKRYSSMNKHHDEVIRQREEITDFTKLDFYNENKKLVDSWIDERENYSGAKDGETVVFDNNAIWNEYDNNIIVLVNNKTTGAAEYFLKKLATVSNVIFIGTNTNGSLVTTNDNILNAEYLGNAGLAIDYGETLLLNDDIDGYGTKGFVPDIITRGDALDAALTLIKNSEK